MATNEASSRPWLKMKATTTRSQGRCLSKPPSEVTDGGWGVDSRTLLRTRVSPMNDVPRVFLGFLLVLSLLSRDEARHHRKTQPVKSITDARSEPLPVFSRSGARSHHRRSGVRGTTMDRSSRSRYRYSAIMEDPDREAALRSRPDLSRCARGDDPDKSLAGLCLVLAMLHGSRVRAVRLGDQQPGPQVQPNSRGHVPPAGRNPLSLWDSAATEGPIRAGPGEPRCLW